MEIETEHKERAVDKIVKYFGIIMALLYVALGIAMIVEPNKIFNISSSYSFPLGFISVVYGFFRGYRIYRKLISA